MHYQAHNVETIREGVEKYGVAGGARVMMSNEYLHAKEALESGIYMTYYCAAKKSECFRLGSKNKCFCGHLAAEHKKEIGTKKINTSCLNCPCKSFMYVPTRPEEVGMWWLPRRKEFDVRTWRAKCKCKHSHEEHAPTRPFRCKSCTNCQDFKCDFACISCDMAWEDHEVLYETEQERRMEKKKVGQDYLPLSDHADIQDMVFNPALANKATPFMRPRPKDAPQLQKKPALTTTKPKPMIGYGEEETKMNSNPFGGQNMYGEIDSSLDKFHPDQKVVMKGPPRSYGTEIKPTMTTSSKVITGSKMIGTTSPKVGTSTLNKAQPTSKIGGTGMNSGIGKGVDSMRSTGTSGTKGVYKSTFK